MAKKSNKSISLFVVFIFTIFSLLVAIKILDYSTDFRSEAKGKKICEAGNSENADKKCKGKPVGHTKGGYTCVLTGKINDKGKAVCAALTDKQIDAAKPASTGSSSGGAGGGTTGGTTALANCPEGIYKFVPMSVKLSGGSQCKIVSDYYPGFAPQGSTQQYCPDSGVVWMLSRTSAECHTSAQAPTPLCSKGHYWGFDRFSGMDKDYIECWFSSGDAASPDGIQYNFARECQDDYEPKIITISTGGNSTQTYRQCIHAD